MAIGLGLMFGFHFPKNFNYPYISQSVTEFWRRWHMTLSNWYRDYLYIPLGGNRKGTFRTYFNLVAVFFLCGLWHGASWTFVVWGLYHGLFLAIERMGLGTVISNLYRPLRHIYTLLAVMVGWVLFRAETFEVALSHLAAMSGLGEGNGLIAPLGKYLQNDVILVLIIGAIGSMPVIPSATKWLASPLSRKIGKSQITLKFPMELLSSLVLLTILLLVIMSLAAGAYNPFIYFRF